MAAFLLQSDATLHNRIADDCILYDYPFMRGRFDDRF